MRVLDYLANADICEVEDCGNEAFRHCISGCGWRCAEHPCMHMADAEGSWLSTGAVIGRMSDSELSDARLRLSLQITAIDNEISRRKFKVEFATPIQKYDEVKARKLLDKFLDSLSPQQLAMLARKLEKDK